MIATYNTIMAHIITNTVNIKLLFSDTAVKYDCGHSPKQALICLKTALHEPVHMMHNE